MQDTFFYINSSDNRICDKNGGPNNNVFYLNGKYVHGPKNSGRFWLEGNQFLSDEGDTGFRVEAEGAIFGPSQNLPWFD